MKSTDPLRGAAQFCLENDLLPEGACVVCAVSGGADSVCLLHWLYSLRTKHGFRLIAAHYNHMLRGEESLRDEQFVRDFVSALPGVELVVGRGDVSAAAVQNKAGIEETARAMRYDFLEKTAQQYSADIIATAHNANDNAETLLLNLMRGCGLNGLCGIPPRRGAIVRPLLTTSRAQIETYLALHGLDHVEDSSNTDRRFARNRVRTMLLPLLERLSPGILDRMTQTIGFMRADEAYLCEQTRQLFPAPEAIPGGLCVPSDTVASLPLPIAVRGVRTLLERLCGTGRCSAVHLHAVVDLCRGDNPSGYCRLPGGLTARRIYDRLEIGRFASRTPLTHQNLTLPGCVQLDWGRIEAAPAIYNSEVQSPYSFYLACDTATALLVRPRCTGDFLAGPGGHRRTLKKLMIDRKTPRHLRDSIPVLDCGGRVAAVAGFGPDRAFLPAPGEPCWFVRCTPNTQKRK